MKTSGTGGASPRSPTGIDRLVGENLRRLRIQRSLTLAQLAAEVGLSHQQLQKYETGSNRLSAGTLFAIAEALDVPIERLFRADEAAPADTGVPAAAAMDALRSEGGYWLRRARSEKTLRQMIQVLKALSSET
ncbi:MAG: helix-turn-helix domain-containing protein [Pannonibacter sp.]